MKTTSVNCDLCKKAINPDVDRYFGFNRLPNNELEYVMRTDTDIDICENCYGFLVALNEQEYIKF